jgi:hypothetical protein
MKQFSENELEALINRSMDDTACPYIKQSLIAAGGSHDWQKITSTIKKWEDTNTLIIVKNPEFAEHNEVCLEMISYINRKSAIPGFLNYE